MWQGAGRARRPLCVPGVMPVAFVTWTRVAGRSWVPTAASRARRAPKPGYDRRRAETRNIDSFFRMFQAHWFQTWDPPTWASPQGGPSPHPPRPTPATKGALKLVALLPKSSCTLNLPAALILETSRWSRRPGPETPRGTWAAQKPKGGVQEEEPPPSDSVASHHPLWGRNEQLKPTERRGDLERRPMNVSGRRRAPCTSTLSPTGFKSQAFTSGA